MYIVLAIRESLKKIVLRTYKRFKLKKKRKTVIDQSHLQLINSTLKAELKIRYVT